MAKDKISDYSSTANSNTDIAGINIDEGCAPSGINDAIRTLMSQLKTWQSGGQDVYIHPAGTASAPSITANGDTNTGIFFPAADTVGITTGGTERARVDSSGNLGLGVTPSAWRSTEKALQIGSAAVFLGRSDTLVANMASNWYVTSGGTNTYMATGNATLYQQLVGEHRWFNAGSGTAGNAITFTQAMTLDASGRLGIGSTSPSAKLTLKNPSSSGEQIIANIESASSSSVVGRLTYDQTNDIMRLVNMSSYSGAGLRFGVNGLDQVNIDLSGNLLVGTTTSTGVGFTFLPQATVVQNNNAGSSGFVFQSYRRSGVEIGYIDQNGTTAVRYSTTSDYRLKEDVLPMTGALAKVAQLKPCTYKWKSDGSNGEGFIAHELAEVCPQAVTRSKDAIDANGNPVYQGIDTSFLVATLTAAIQELKAIVDAQAAEIAALKG